MGVRVNESLNKKGASIDIVLKSQDGEIFEQLMKLGFMASNNEAEYEVLINGLNMAEAIGMS